jgi:hypothetical protein
MNLLLVVSSRDQVRAGPGERILDLLGLFSTATKMRDDLG